MYIYAKLHSFSTNTTTITTAYTIIITSLYFATKRQDILRDASGIRPVLYYSKQ